MLLYMISVSGVMIQIHFCGRNLQSWAINAAPKNDNCCTTDCSNVVKVSKSSCCKDKTLTLKVTQDQIVSAFQFLFSGLQTAIVAQPIPLTTAYLKAGAAPAAYFANAPPGLWQNIPLFKLHQRFTYYG